MAHRLAWGFAVLAIGMALALHADEPSEETVLRGGWVFDTQRETFVPNSGIVVRAGKFLEVGANLDGRDLAAAHVIDLQSDDYILPGIIDLHAHYNVNLFGRKRKDEYRVNPIIYLANGVTSTFPAGEFDPEGMLEARRRIDRGEQVGPRIFNSGPYFGTARPGWNREASLEDIRAEVDAWAARGAAGFKAKGIGAAHLQALIEGAHRHGLTVTGHLDSGFRGSVNPRDAILMGIDRIEHFLGGDAITPDKPVYSSLVDCEPGTAEFRRIVDLFVRHRVFFDATITAYGYFGRRTEGFDHWVDESAFFTPYVREHLRNSPPRRISEQFEKIYRVKRRTIKPFFDAGGLITLGTDHPSAGEYLPGFGAHRELDALVLSGIPPAAAIRIATMNGARALRVGDRLGSIETGKLADLFIVMGDPMVNIRSTRTVHRVMKAGRMYSSRELLASVEGRLGPADAREAEGW